MAGNLFCESRKILKTILFRNWSPTALRAANNIALNITRSVQSTVDHKEMLHLSSLRHLWWDPYGPIKPLQSLNYLRLPYIRDGLVQVSPGEKISTCLKGKKILEVGCGGGLLAERLVKLGAEVTGIDPCKELIQLAQDHSSNNKNLGDNLPTYIYTTIEEHCEKYGNHYDAVVASEVLDHVVEKELFVESCVRATKPGGKLFFTVPTRTRAAQFYIIFINENITKTIPKGTHQYSKFMRPDELRFMLEINDCSVEHVRGLNYYALADYWEWLNTKMFWFAIQAVKAN